MRADRLAAWESNRSQSVCTLGLDLGGKRHALCVIDAAGQTVEERRLPNARASLNSRSNELGRDFQDGCGAGVSKAWVSGQCGNRTEVSFPFLFKVNRIQSCSKALESRLIQSANGSAIPRSFPKDATITVEVQK